MIAFTREQTDPCPKPSFAGSSFMLFAFSILLTNFKKGRIFYSEAYESHHSAVTQMVREAFDLCLLLCFCRQLELCHELLEFGIVMPNSRSKVALSMFSPRNQYFTPSITRKRKNIHWVSRILQR